MKKILLGGTVLVLSLGLFTGCGSKALDDDEDNDKPKEESKTLTCERTEDGYSMKMKFKYDKKGKEVKEYIAEISMEVDKDELDDTYDDAKDDCDDYLSDDYEGITCEVTKKNNKITQTITIDIENADPEEMDELGFDLEELKPLEEMREEGEDGGFTCK